MSSADFLPGAQVEEIRYQQSEWKAGYAAVIRHKQWTIVGVALAVYLALRRWKVPVFAILVWGLAFVLAFGPVILILVTIEAHRRRRVRQALVATFADNPFPV